MRVMRGELKMAIASVRATRWRSLLTMLGIIIGIVSVVTVVSIGEGAKQQIAGQLGHFGKDLITVLPGSAEQRQHSTSFIGTSVLDGAINQSSLGVQDLRTIQKVPHVAHTAPLGQVPGQLSARGHTAPGQFTVIATSGDLPELLNQQVPYGEFFSGESELEPVAVIGKNVAENMFEENVPLGMRFQFRGQTFIVRGVFGDFANVPLSPIANFDNTVFIPYQVANRLMNNNAMLYAILAKPDSAAHTQPTIKAINGALLQTHGHQQDFSVLNHEQAVASTAGVLDLLTKLIAGIAAISLLVGGVGIMNIMLVSVTERMHEIGVRKAIGATNQQIWRQFMLESAVLSGVGGVIGVGLSLLISVLLRAYSDLKPVVSWEAVAIATAVAVIVGVLFGTAPALKAARKDPIEALRHE